MKIVITGALGHIGSRLIRELPAVFQHAEIVMVDDLSTHRFASLFHLPADGRYKFIRTDILDIDLVEICAGADVVIHLAAITDAAGSVDIPERVNRVNLVGTEKVARACIETGSPLVFLSTTSVYGVSSSLVDETCQELRPQSPYAHSKLLAEESLVALGDSDGLDFVICRFGTIFGVSPGMRFHTAVNKFVWQAAFDNPLTVWRTALHQERPYLALDDAVRALCLIIRERLFDQRIYNVVTANATVADVIEYIRPYVSRLRIDYVDSPIMNQLSYRVSSDSFRSLGFEFTGSLPLGIAQTIQLLRNDLRTEYPSCLQGEQQHSRRTSLIEVDLRTK